MFTELLSQCIQEAGVEYAHLEPPCPEEEIAQAEGVDPGRVRDSIRKGLRKLAKQF